MQWIETLVMVVSMLGLGSTLLCGLWLRYTGKTKKASDVKFHMKLGIFAVTAALVTISLSAL